MSESAPPSDTLHGKGTVPLGFAEDSEAVYLVAPGKVGRVADRGPPSRECELRLPQGRASGPAELVTQPEQRELILDLFRTKYGPERYARWYEHPSRVLRVRTSVRVPTAAGAEPHYYEWLQSEFDNVADDYDHHITGNRMNRLLRDRSLARLRPMFRDSRALLEVGCGSGMETLPLLREGHEILAVDISDRMLEVVRKKAHAEGLSERPRTRHPAARELGSLQKELGDGAFDGAYSTYGALNCEPDLTGIPGAFHALLQPDAPLLLGIYNRWCLFELLGYSISMQGAERSDGGGIRLRAGASRFCIDVVRVLRRRLPTVVREDLRGGIPRRSTRAPPSIRPHHLCREIRLPLSPARGIGRVGGPGGALNSLGDHFLMTLRREPKRLQVPESAPSAGRPPRTGSRSHGIPLGGPRGIGETHCSSECRRSPGRRRRRGGRGPTRTRDAYGPPCAVSRGRIRLHPLLAGAAIPLPALGQLPAGTELCGHQPAGRATRGHIHPIPNPRAGAYRAGRIALREVDRVELTMHPFSSRAERRKLRRYPLGHARFHDPGLGERDEPVRGEPPPSVRENRPWPAARSPQP